MRRCIHAVGSVPVRRRTRLLKWLPGYPRTWVTPHLVGGLTTWVVMIPSTMADPGWGCTGTVRGHYATIAAMAIEPISQPAAWQGHDRFDMAGIQGISPRE